MTELAWWMKYPLALIAMSSTALLAETSVSDFRGKNRLLVIPVAREGFAAELERQKEELAERDLRVFILRGASASKFAAPPELAVELARRLASDPAMPQIHFIGKDGVTTLRWTAEEFSFAKLYASIDAMPMRRREMQKRE